MLSGPLGGSLFNRESFTRIQIWTSTSTSQATKRQRNLSLQTILPGTPAGTHSPSSSSVPPADA